MLRTNNSTTPIQLILTICAMLLLPLSARAQTDTVPVAAAPAKAAEQAAKTAEAAAQPATTSGEAAVKADKPDEAVKAADTAAEAAKAESPAAANADSSATVKVDETPAPVKQPEAKADAADNKADGKSVAAKAAENPETPAKALEPQQAEAKPASDDKPGSTQAETAKADDAVATGQAARTGAEPAATAIKEDAKPASDKPASDKQTAEKAEAEEQVKPVAGSSTEKVEAEVKTKSGPDSKKTAAESETMPAGEKAAAGDKPEPAADKVAEPQDKPGEQPKKDTAKSPEPAEQPARAAKQEQSPAAEGEKLQKAAEDPTEPATAPVVAPVRPEERVHPVIAAVRGELGINASSANVGASDNGDKKLSETAALKRFYGAPKRRPLWLNDGGVVASKALDVWSEFEDAEKWGLRRQDFTLELPARRTAASWSTAKKAAFELKLSRLTLKYARYARGGRIDPRKLSRFQDRGPRTPDYPGLLEAIASGKQPRKLLQAQHPRHPQFEALRQKLVELGDAGHEMHPTSATVSGAKNSFPVAGPTLRQGDSHPQVASLRRRLKVKAGGSSQRQLFDDKLAAAVKAFQKRKGLGADGVVGPNTRAALAGVKPGKESHEKLRARLLINMERWRWMPEKLANDRGMYVWTNVPELRARVMKDGKAIFDEKAIAGLPGKQTPMFSDEMEWIEFNPTWYIPNSIKVADVLPSLKRKGRVMSRYHLKINCGAHGSDWTKIDWNKVDIRRCSVIQPAGVKSVLGDFKFKFPNRHAVYMHDTLTPYLFNQTHRILSHGCVRVQNPKRMAEIILQQDKGLKPGRVQSLLDRRGVHKEHLARNLPVHMTYFSTWVDEDGRMRHHRDYYGHDKRLAQAMLGRGNLFSGAVYGGSQRLRPRKPQKPRQKEKRRWVPGNDYIPF